MSASAIRGTAAWASRDKATRSAQPAALGRDPQPRRDRALTAWQAGAGRSSSLPEDTPPRPG
ncbi:hypothetical protein AMYX_24550 [Anaeromyxobacter diazotrophicus]|uniref:Uncharacterized protein n=1 Tax=Anaeromyxobacter diazotrophicus TaxID=2590199 RepID=A0A7I9VMT8_9BACT|nr:hypothetical protein AMYX_24550 [Anaeromyxobacter diazotrophicus]